VFLWYVIWGTAITGYTLTAGETNRIITFLLLVSLFWGAQVCMNVSHTTTCGVAATWYFNSGKLDNPSRKAFKRTMTTSFGGLFWIVIGGRYSGIASHGEESEG